MSMKVIGVDIGGSNLKAGRVSKGIIEKKSLVPVRKEASSKRILEDLYDCIESVINKDSESIGIGVPGVVDPVTGVVYDVQNIPSWKKIELKDLMEERYNLPVFINNDANCFAMGEKIYGKGRNYKDFIGLSLGTGIGMGIIINEKLYSGVLCGAGEIGMVTYKNSIIEDYAGSFFFTNNYGINSKDLFFSASKGDLFAIQAFNEYGAHLGEVIKNILYLYAPEAIVIGGSISKAYNYFQKSLEFSLESFAYQKQLENFNIKISNKPGSAILGAASLCF
ncbi:ROK family protein [Antarcticibacterium flavum]|uniref:ROK family protein n=2 Tax=Flavobacteriaceae TaxID=49546 RepID=A0A5B7X2L2_9FLAO|nr:sugar kinase [Antarcticibacterium sp. W02-3]QCY69647.1 ROK family protein [Antarcticibacterium flavum]